FLLVFVFLTTARTGDSDDWGGECPEEDDQNSTPREPESARFHASFPPDQFVLGDGHVIAANQVLLALQSLFFENIIHLLSELIGKMAPDVLASSKRMAIARFGGLGGRGAAGVGSRSLSRLITRFPSG